MLLSACSGGGGGASGPAAVPDSPNDPPVAGSDSVFVSPDGSSKVDVLSNDVDPDGDEIHIIEITQPANGSAVIHDNGTAGNPGDDYVLYTPNAGFSGTDTFAYTIGDSRNGRARANAEILIFSPAGNSGTGNNIRPDANGDDASMAMDTPALVPVLLNDSDPDGDDLLIISITTPVHGTAVIDDNGTPADTTDDHVLYMPDMGYSGHDSLVYTVSDGIDDASAAISLTIVDGGPPPVTDLTCGSFLKGPVEGAIVALYPVDGQGNRASPDPVAWSVTDGAGQWCVELPFPRIPLLAVTSGGSFLDESDSVIDPTLRRVLTLQATDEFEAILPATENHLAITVYSNALLVKSRRETVGANFLSVFESNRTRFTQAFGFDVVSTRLTDPASPDPTTAEPVRQYAMASGGAANVLNRATVALAETTPNFSVMHGLVDDLSDCVLDGQDLNGTVTVNVGGSPQDFPTGLDLNNEILRFRNNNSNAWESTTLIQVDTTICSQSGELPDTTPPTFNTNPVDISVLRDDASGTSILNPAIQVFLGSAVATDDRDGAVPVITTLTDGSALPATFPIGDTVVLFAATDTVGNLATVTATVSVLANVSPTAIAISGNTIAENLAAGALVGTFTTTDPDIADVHGYALVAGAGDTDNASFAISGDQLVTTAVFDFETQSAYSVRISTDDGNGGTFEQSFAITVTDANDAPTAIAIDSSTVAENLAAGALVGTFTTTDPDIADVHSYALVAGVGDTDNASFAISSDQLVTTAVFDFETQSAYSVRISTDDGNGGTFEQSFAITVTDANDAPTAIAIDSSTVAENLAAGALVGTFTTTDPDIADVHSYALVAGVGDTDNASFAISGDQLVTTAVFDFETQSAYSVRTSTDDGNGGTFEQSFAITVTNVNETPTTVGIANVSVLEDAVDHVIDLFAVFDDPEEADADLTYTITANTNPGLFTSLGIDGVAGTLTLDFAPDTNGNADLTVRASDTPGLWVESTFTVNVQALADLSLSLAVDDPTPTVGDDVVFTLDLTNAGPSTATGVTVALALGPGYTFVSSDDPAGYDEIAGVWTLPSVNGTVLLNITATVNTTGPYDVIAEVATATEPDPDSTPGNGAPAEDDYTMTSTVPVKLADLSITTTVDQPIPETLDPVTITVTVTNSGPFDTLAVQLQNLVPAGLTYDTVTPSMGTYAPITGNWDGFGLTVGSSETLIINATVTAAAPATITSRTEVLSSEKPDPGGNAIETLDIIVVGTGVPVSWLGGDLGGPTDWNIGNNWSTGSIPGAFDRITIPITLNDPVLDINRSVVSIDVRSGATLHLNSNELTVFGEVKSDGLISGPCPASRIVMLGGVISGSLPEVELAGNVSAGGTIDVACNLQLTGGQFHQAGQTINVAGDFSVLLTGILLQHHGGADDINVMGNVLFNGGDHSLQVNGSAPLNDGLILVAGNFAQMGHQHSFAAENKHTVVFNGAATQTVFLANPDNSNPDQGDPPLSGSRFARLMVDKNPADGVVDFQSDAAVLKRLIIGELYTPVLTSTTGNIMIAGGVDIKDITVGQTQSVIFDHLPLKFVEGDDFSDFEGAAFTNMDPARPQIEIVRPDLDGLSKKEFRFFNFETLPDTASGGYYILAENTDPDITNNLTLTVINSQPMHGEPWTNTVGNFTIVWGGATDDSDGDGITDADEFTNGTDPRSTDSDGDGLSDSEELAAGTDALSPDSDGDGVSDGVEVLAGTDPNTAMVPGNIYYVRPAPLGDDANGGTSWSDALATNIGVRSTIPGGASPADPIFVLYDGGIYDPLVVDRDNVVYAGSLGPGIFSPPAAPTTIFDASSVPETSVAEIVGSTGITLQHIRLTGGSRTGAGGGCCEGGGLFVDNASQVTVQGSEIVSNVAKKRGGGFFVESGGALTLSGSRVSGNTVTDGGGAGVSSGGAGVVYGTLWLENTVVADNRQAGTDGVEGGGALYVSGADQLTVLHSAFLGNYSASHGGALWIDGVPAPTSLKNNLFVGNVADQGAGGAVAIANANLGAFLRFESNTVAHNQVLTTGLYGGGVDLVSADNAELRDNIVYFNDDGVLGTVGGDNYFDHDAVVFSEYNDFEDDPTLGVNFNYDGNPDFEQGYYLEPGSPAVDRGSVTATAAGLESPFTTQIDGSGDAGVLDQGYHHSRASVGLADDAVLAGWQCDNPGELTLTVVPTLFVRGVGILDLGSGRLVEAKITGASSTGVIDDRSSITNLDPGGADYRVAIDEGDGRYRITVFDVIVSPGTVQIGLKIDNIDDNITVTTPSLVTIPGC